VGGRALISHAILFAGLSLLLGCTDKGIVGATSCDSACAQDQVCHPMLLRCVECAAHTDCASKNDGKLPYCDSHSSACVQCRDQHDCQDPTPRCVAGACKSAADDNAGHGSDDSNAGHGGDRGKAGGAGE
jgi:hypothetical protein